MNIKKIIVLCSLLFVLFLCIGISTANENITIESAECNAEDTILEDTGNDEKYADYNNEYNAKIIANDLTLEYDPSDYAVAVRIVDNNNNPISTAKPTCDKYNLKYDLDGYYFFYQMHLNAGTHKLKISLNDGHYKAEPVTMTLTIVKSTFDGTIDCDSYYGTDKTTLTMKATVNPSEGKYEDGYVTFKVNGKSYKVKTKNGVATKKIKIKKSGTYTYTAELTDNNYKNSKSDNAKLFVYSTSKKARTFKVKGYKIVVPVNKYNKLVIAKNTNKRVLYEIKTKKRITQKISTQKTGTKWKYVGKMYLEDAHYKNYKTKNYVKHWISDGEYYYTCDAYKKVSVNKIQYKSVKAKVSIIISYGGKKGGQYALANKYYLCLNTPYQNPGYESCKPTLYGAKKSNDITKLNHAKTTKW